MRARGDLHRDFHRGSGSGSGKFALTGTREDLLRETGRTYVDLWNAARLLPRRDWGIARGLDVRNLTTT